MTTLVSLDVSRRQKEKDELKQIQKYEMGLKHTNQSQNLSDKSSSAFNDRHIYSAMNEVKKSDETIDENLSRISGTFFWNRSTPDKRKLTLEKTVRELTIKADLDDENDYKNTLDAEKLITKYGTPDHLKVMMNIKNKHDQTGQLGKRDKKIRDGLYQKYLNNVEVGDVTDTKKSSSENDISEETSWDMICKQLGKSRLQEGYNTRWLGTLKDTGISTSPSRLLSLKRSSQID